ncbi:MAG TPA: putative lipid II flippase FtsW [Steroidobacteraceae bacterium]|jgi:cell division protein FtsW
MNSTVSSMTYARSGSRSAMVHIDTVTLGVVLAIVLLGLVMVTSASISIASKETGYVFYYLERQLVLTVLGSAGAALVFCIPTRLIERVSMPLLVVALALLFVVLLPGLGHTVNGSRRWIRLIGFNFQASELARVLILIYLASYAVRRAEELRGSLKGLAKPLGLLACVTALLLAEPDFGAAAVLFATGFGLLFVAGARLRDVIGMTIIAGAAFAALAFASPYRILRIISYRDPWADQYNTGFQLAQSLIAIGRGHWTGVGLGESVQKLFYLPEAHTDFLFAVLAEELGLIGVVSTLLLFMALVWRSFRIARLAQTAGLPFGAYVAAGFGLWIGIQAFVNIGVNMGVLPTKGLTLPLMSYGRSSLIVTLVWVGLLLRVYHEAMSEGRGSASARRRSDDEEEEEA